MNKEELKDEFELDIEFEIDKNNRVDMNQVIELISAYNKLFRTYKKQKEVIDKLKNKTKENIENAKCEITTLTIGDKAYYQYIEKILDNYVDILKEVE